MMHTLGSLIDFWGDKDPRRKSTNCAKRILIGFSVVDRTVGRCRSRCSRIHCR